MTTRPHFIRLAKDRYVRTDDIVMVSYDVQLSELGITLVGGKYYPINNKASVPGVSALRPSVEFILEMLPRRGDFVEINFDVFLRADVINFVGLDPKTGLVGVDTTFGQYFQAPVFQTPEGLLRAIGGEV